MTFDFKAFDIVTRTPCAYCESTETWDRALYLDARGEVTTYRERVLVMESRVCLVCKEWQPLGPANDVGVEHEIRAAEISIIRADWDGCIIDDLYLVERLGWNDHERGGDDLYALDGRERSESDRSAYLAGWLGREIAEGEFDRIAAALGMPIGSRP